MTTERLALAFRVVGLLRLLTLVVGGVMLCAGVFSLALHAPPTPLTETELTLLRLGLVTMLASLVLSLGLVLARD